MAYNQQTKPAAGQQLAPIDHVGPSRLPVTEAFRAKMNIKDEATWRVLTDQIFPEARTVEGIKLALDYCRSRNLDIMKKPVHIVPVYSSVLKRMVERVWPGIAEVRTTATRTGLYAGNDEAVLGPMIKHEFVDKYEDERDSRNNRDVKHTVEYPEWCRFVVHKFVQGQKCSFTATVYWLETYATVNRNSEMPNEMWRKRARSQLVKCAEAAALRMAFPEELGSQYVAEEMEGKIIDGELAHQAPAITMSQNPAGGSHQGAVTGAVPPRATVGAAPTIDLTAERDQTATAQAAALRATAEQMASPSNQTAKINMADSDEVEFDFEEFQKVVDEAPDELALDAVCEGRKYDIYNRFIDDPINMNIANKIKQRRKRELRAGAVVEGAPV